MLLEHFDRYAENVPNATILCYWTIIGLGKATSCLFGGSMLYRGPRPDITMAAQENCSQDVMVMSRVSPGLMVKPLNRTSDSGSGQRSVSTVRRVAGQGQGYIV